MKKLHLVTVAMLCVGCTNDAPVGDESTGSVAEAFTDATTWQQDGNTCQKAHVNGYETAITRANAASLREAWAVYGTAPTNASIVGGRAYTGSSDGTTRAIDVASGTTVWTKKLPAETYYAPAVGYGRVFVTNGTKLYALSATGGTVVFQVNHASTVAYSAPLLADGKVFVRDADGTIWAYDAKATGTVTPLFSIGANAAADPSFANGILYVPTYDGTIAAFDANGAPLWATGSIGGVSYVPVAIWPPRMIATAYGDSGVTEVAFDATNGAPLWSTPLTGATDATGPAVGYGKVFVGLAGAQEMWSLSLTDGSLVWKAALLDDPTDAPAIANQVAFIATGRTTGRLVAFSTTCATGGATCDSLAAWWVDPYGYAPSIANGRVYFSATSATISLALP
jgi:outer membrane protein assembly factor BamB